jgi:hypothetical protein
MKESSGNIDEYDCPRPEIFARNIEPLQKRSVGPNEGMYADFVYEVWDNEQRKMHIQIPMTFELRKWTHVVITAANEDVLRPSIKVYINNNDVYTEEAGHLPQTNTTTKNYIGKSNWMDSTSDYENADELFKGKIFDFRMYNMPMNANKIKETFEWGKKMIDVE